MRMFILSFLSVLVFVFLAWSLGGPPSLQRNPGVFVVPEEKQGIDVIQKLVSDGYIRSPLAARVVLSIFYRGKEISSGGYRLDTSMHVFEVLDTLFSGPKLVWVSTAGCIRREQVGEILEKALGWDTEKTNTWNSLFLTSRPEWKEGVYYPDTYLLPIDESPEETARRFISRFEENIAPLSEQFLQKNIKWTTALKIASLIQREAAGKHDMNLISGIIWNRLNTGMKLEIDAIMQYTKGKNTEGKWWGSIDLSQKRADSPYNSYLRKGLPPTPICSPGIDAIRAALEPEDTECLYYLHDKNKEIHCSKTYQEHLRNIDTYLRG